MEAPMNRFVSTAAATLLLAVPVAPSALAQSTNDFVAEAIQGDNSEIMLGTLASQRAYSADVRKYGQTLMQDHATARQQIRTANTAGTQKDSAEGPSVEAQQEHDKLLKLTGPDFDREFLAYMVKDHEKDIAKFEQAAAARQGQTSQIAKEQLATLHKHLKTAQDLQAKLPKTGDKR